MDEPVEEGQTFNLALGLDQFGRGVVLLRPVRSSETEPASGTQSRDQAQMVKELGPQLGQSGIEGTFLLRKSRVTPAILRLGES
jgi:hypothetical protein